MLEESVFEEEKLKRFVKENYDLDISVVDKINRGSANIYSLNNDEYILKEFQSKYNVEEIKKEIAVINHLFSKGINVPEYIPTINNEFYKVYNERVIIIQKYIKGDVLESNTGNKEQVKESATYYGKIVLALEDLDYELPIKNVEEWVSKEKREKSLLKHQQLLKELNKEDKYYEIIKKDLTGKVEMLKLIDKKLDLEEVKKLTVKNTHGDYSLQQFIYENGKISAVIDFATACKMPIVWEVIRSYSYIDKDAKDGPFNLNNFVMYVKEVCKYIKLNKADIKYMVYIYLIQILNSVYGYKQYIKDNSKISLLEFGIFRTRLCRYLFDNADVITEKLENEIYE